MNFIDWLSGRRRTLQHLSILWILAFIVLILPAGCWDIRGPDEGRYTQVAKELLTRDNWLALTVMGVPYDQKPPLAFWLLAATLKANGGEPNSWFLRMPSVFAAIGLITCTYFLGRKFANAQTGLISALILFSSIAFLDDAPTVELNMLYAFFTTASLAVWLLNFDKPRLSWMQTFAFWLLLTAAFLVKGPLAILVIFSALGYTTYSRRSWQPFHTVRTVIGLPIMLLIIGGWFLGQSRAFGQEFVENQISGETVDRFLKGDHHESFWYYFPRFFTAILGPWTFFLIAALIDLWKNRKNQPSVIAPLLGWMGIPFIVLLLANGKRVPYVLPLLPAACLVSGIWINNRLLPSLIKPVHKKVVTALLVTGILSTLAAGITGLFFIDNLVDEYHAAHLINVAKLHPTWWITGALLLSIITISFIKSTHGWLAVIWSISLSILIIMLLDFVTIKPAFDPGKSTRVFSETVEELLAANSETTLVTLPDLAEPEFHVYSHYSILSRSRKNLNLDDPSLPNLLALKDEDIETSETDAIAAGYKPIRELTVTKNPVILYLRDKKTTGI